MRKSCLSDCLKWVHVKGSRLLEMASLLLCLPAYRLWCHKIQFFSWVDDWEACQGTFFFIVAQEGWGVPIGQICPYMPNMWYLFLVFRYSRGIWTIWQYQLFRLSQQWCTDLQLPRSAWLLQNSWNSYLCIPFLLYLLKWWGLTIVHNRVWNKLQKVQMPVQWGNATKADFTI